MVDEAYMTWARGRRWPVRPWTVNEEADMRKLMALGVDAIITDVPDLARRLV